MKLYTEEQVKFAILSAYLTGVTRPPSYEEAEEVLYNSLTPIRIPSDEEIEKAANGNHDHYEGAMWLKYKYLNQNK